MKKLLIIISLVCFFSEFTVQAMDQRSSVQPSSTRRRRRRQQLAHELPQAASEKSLSIQPQVDLSTLSDSSKLDLLIDTLQEVKGHVETNRRLLNSLIGLEGNLWKKTQQVERDINQMSMRVEKIEDRLGLSRKVVDLTDQPDQ